MPTLNFYNVYWQIPSYHKGVYLVRSSTNSVLLRNGQSQTCVKSRINAHSRSRSWGNLTKENQPWHLVWCAVIEDANPHEEASLTNFIHQAERKVGAAMPFAYCDSSTSICEIEEDQISTFDPRAVMKELESSFTKIFNQHVAKIPPQTEDSDQLWVF
jgi:hypothetical protein